MTAVPDLPPPNAQEHNQRTSGGGTPHPPANTSSSTHTGYAGGSDSPPPTHRPHNHRCLGGGTPPPPTDTPTIDPNSMGDAGRRLADYLVTFHADMLTDAETLRVATENRLRTLTSTDDWGHGVNPMLPEIAVIEAHLDQIQALEHGATLALKRAVRRHYLADWQKTTVGVGEKQLARLIGCIGDPATRTHPSQLRSYCGVGDAQRQTRRRGQRCNWNIEAGSRLHVIAESCIKQIGPPSTKRRSPYRDVYDNGRARYADAVHSQPCVRCGPPGKPAAEGSELSDGHKHMRAMRLVKKAILLDLWREARQTLPTSHSTTTSRDASGDAPTSQATPDTHEGGAGGGDDGEAAA